MLNAQDIRLEQKRLNVAPQLKRDEVSTTTSVVRAWNLSNAPEYIYETFHIISCFRNIAKCTSSCNWQIDNRNSIDRENTEIIHQQIYTKQLQILSSSVEHLTRRFKLRTREMCYILIRDFGTCLFLTVIIHLGKMV